MSEGPPFPETEVPALLARLAGLARLGLSLDERTRLEVELAQILAYVRQLESFEASGSSDAAGSSAPEPSATSGIPREREDRVEESLSSSRALAEARAAGRVSQDGHFLVPAVLGPAVLGPELGRKTRGHDREGR